MLSRLPCSQDSCPGRLRLVPRGGPAKVPTTAGVRLGCRTRNGRGRHRPHAVGCVWLPLSGRSRSRRSKEVGGQARPQPRTHAHTHALPCVHAHSPTLTHSHVHMPTLTARARTYVHTFAHKLTPYSQAHSHLCTHAHIYTISRALNTLTHFRMPARVHYTHTCTLARTHTCTHAHTHLHRHAHKLTHVYSQ